MEVFYSVKLNEKSNDITKINKLTNKTKNVYLLSKIKPNIKFNIPFKSLNELIIDDKEILCFAFDCYDISKQKNKIFRNIKHLKRQGRDILQNSFQVVIFNYEEKYNSDILDLIRSIKVVLLSTKAEKYDYIYDSVCDYLDNEFESKNICEFENDKCIAKRDFNLTCGCCRHYKGLLSNEFVQCEYLVNKRCSTKCMPCKMFTCHYIVKNKGIKYNIQDFFLLRKFFNPIQKLIIIKGYFTSKEKLMKKILLWSI